MRQGERELDAFLSVGVLTEALGEAQKGAGDASAYRQFGVVNRFAAAAELPRQAAHDVVAQFAVIHSLLRIDGRQIGVMHSDDGLRVLAAVQSGGADHVAGAVRGQRYALCPPRSGRWL